MDVILDSGAYSAWTRGIEIDREQYADYILNNMKYYRYFVNLDCIPSVPGDKHITQDKVEASAAKGWDNLEYLLSRGIPKDRLLPVFHQGENFFWLEKMRDEGFPYIGISPGNDRSTNERISWMDECMYYACDSSGLPYMRWHGFGVTGFRTMKAIPWYSVDSITYAFMAGHGSIFFPQPGRGKLKYDFSGHPLTANVCQGRASAKPKAVSGGTHFEEFTDATKEFCRGYLDSIGIPWGVSTYRKEKPGYKADRSKREHVIRSNSTPDYVVVETRVEPGVSNDIGCRTLVNTLYLYEFAALRPAWPWRYTYPMSNFGLLRGNTHRSAPSSVSAPPEPLRIYFASAFHLMNMLRRKVIEHSGRDWYRQLVSYHYMGNCTSLIKSLEEWNETEL